MAAENVPRVPDLITVDVPRGTRVLAVSDLHLRPAPNEASDWATAELGPLLRSWSGPGILLLVGDILELWAIMPADPAGSLEAHRELLDAVADFAAGAGRRVVYTIGNHDGRVAWDGSAWDLIRRELHAEIALTAELRPEGRDHGRVRVEHGHAFDPANRFDDPRSPHDSPVGQHIVQDVLASVEPHEKSTWLDGVETLSNPRTFPAFISSRLFYRRIARRSWWFLLPVALAVVAHIPVTVSLFSRGSLDFRPFTRTLLAADIFVVAVILLLGGLAFLAVRRSWKDASGIMAQQRGRGQNDNSRAAAQELVTKGFGGMVCAHSHHPELSALEGGFYANTGSGTRVLDQADARFGFPHVFLPRIQLSWVVLEHDGDGWRVRLTEGRREIPGASAFERRMARRQELRPRPLGVTATYSS